MRKTIQKTALILLITPLLGACVASNEQLNSLNLKVRNQDNRLVELEKITNSDGSVQKRQADISQEIDRLAAELLQLEGQLDETSHRNQSLTEENDQLRTMLTSKVAELEEKSSSLDQKVLGLDSNLASVQGSMEEDARRRAAEALENAEKARQRAEEAAEAKRQAAEAKRRAEEAAAAKIAAAAEADSPIRHLKPRELKKKVKGKKGDKATVAQSTPKTNKPSSAPSTSKNEAESAYDNGLAQYRSKDYKGATTTFSTFLDKYPKDKLAPNARYWLGSSMLQSGDYSGAVLEFQNIVDGYPNHHKAPEALLQQAKAFEHFGEKAVQIKLYKDVLAYYPDSDQAKTAKKMLKKLQ